MGVDGSWSWSWTERMGLAPPVGAPLTPAPTLNQPPPPPGGSGSEAGEWGAEGWGGPDMESPARPSVCRDERAVGLVPVRG